MRSAAAGLPAALLAGPDRIARRRGRARSTCPPRPASGCGRDSPARPGAMGMACWTTRRSGACWRRNWKARSPALFCPGRGCSGTSCPGWPSIAPSSLSGSGSQVCAGRGDGLHRAAVPLTGPGRRGRPRPRRPGRDRLGRNRASGSNPADRRRCAASAISPPRWPAASCSIPGSMARRAGARAAARIRYRVSSDPCAKAAPLAILRTPGTRAKRDRRLMSFPTDRSPPPRPPSR